MFAAEREENKLGKIEKMLDLLQETRSEGCFGNGWGYNFDWQSRAFYVPQYTPTIVNSSFIGHALLDTYRYTGLERAKRMALPIRDFILEDLNRTVENDALCLSYTPLDHLTVHNANLLGASLLIRLYGLNGDEETKLTALSALRYSLRRQRHDGSWPYAETEYQSWIDSFHTGFNLQSLWCFIQEGLGQEVEDAFNRGIEFYRGNFFLEDGTPKYYHDGIYPIDIHSSAQAVFFFSGLGEENIDFARLVAGWMIENLQDENGYFYFQKNRLYTNRIPYMRWSQAWAFHALSELQFRWKESGETAKMDSSKAMTDSS